MSQARNGPVQFEKADADPFGVDAMIKEVTSGEGGSGSGGGGVGAGGSGGGSKRQYGLQEKEDGKTKKRARVDEDEQSDG